MSDKKTTDTIKPVEFDWSSDDTMMSTGVIAQEVGSITLDISNAGAAGSVYAIDTTDTIDLSSITIGSGGNTTISSNPYTFSTWETKNTLNGVEEIHTKSGKKIDVDELAEVVETIKKRLLILTPNFEMHEKYPMLKELYNEYKAMERLLSGPDREENND